MATRRVPTIKDLRVKLCYICREEEIVGPDPNTPSPEPSSPPECPTCDHQPDAPPTPPTPPPQAPAPTAPAAPVSQRAWTHPCTCTLIAHEDCLLKWIQTSQSSSNQQRNDNALKCPQCGTHYELESVKPRILKALTVGNKALQRLGRYFTVFGAASLAGLVGTSVYIGLTAYGAWAVEKFIGRELFQDILTDDPTNWPWSAYFNLPIIPLTLVLSRFSSSSTFGITHLLVWLPSMSASINVERARARSQLATRGLGEGLFYDAISNGSISTTHEDDISTPFGILSVLTPKRNWPPTPNLLGLLGIPLVRALYRVLYARIYQKVLGVPLPARQRRRRRVGRGNNGDAENRNGGGGNAEGNAAARGNRDGLQFNEGPFVIRIRANVDGNDDPVEDEPAAPEPEADRVNANPNPDAVAVEAAEQLIDINASSLGRRIGGALLVPLIASKMGSLLLYLSRHSNLLRLFLGIRQRRGSVAAVGLGLAGVDQGGLRQRARQILTKLPWGLSGSDADLDPLTRTSWSSMNIFQRARLGLKFFTVVLWGGAKPWVDADDPVWWRNCVGFGLFVVLKDCVQLWHLYLAKRELESRKVKNRDFRGVDLTQLDLLPDFLATQ